MNDEDKITKKAAIREAFMVLLIKEKKSNIKVQCGLRALDLIMNMDEYDCDSLKGRYLFIVGCYICLKLDFDLDPWNIVYKGKVIFN
jgi:hypothetical protein